MNKKLNIVIIAIFSGFLSISSAQLTATQLTTLAAHRIHANQVALAKMTHLEKELHKCVEEFAPNFANLDMSNIYAKRNTIEDGRVKLLAILEQAEAKELTPKYKEAKKLLKEMDIFATIPLPAVSSFKKVLSLIPVPTKNIISETVKDKVMRSLLGL